MTTTFEPERCVKEIETGRLGIVIRRISHEVYSVGFGVRPWMGRDVSTATIPWEVRDMVIDQLLPCDVWDVMDWREAQGWGGGTPIDSETREPLARPADRFKGHL